MNNLSLYEKQSQRCDYYRDELIKIVGEEGIKLFDYEINQIQSKNGY